MSPVRAQSLKNGKPVISEKVFTAQVTRLAQFYKWKTAHFRPAMDRHGRWKTAVQGDGKGFPDFVLVHEEKARLIFAELKSETGKVEPDQEKWLQALRAVRCFGEVCMEVYVWRPDDYDEIMEILKK